MNQQIKQVRWSVGQVAQACNRQTSAIRFWEKKLPFLKPDRRTSDNQRYYSQQQLINLLKVSVMLQFMTLKGVASVWNTPHKDLFVQAIRQVKEL